MFAHRITFALSLGFALGVPATSAAQDLDARFSYLEGGLIGTFVNDVEDAGVITGGGNTLAFETDAGGGGFLSGAWQVGEHFHLFGAYAAASQDLEVSDGTITVEGDFQLVRWRAGAGYARATSDSTAFYGRISLDRTELKDVEVAGFNLDADLDDNGIGGEIGVIWAATPAIHLQAHVRYTSVGGVADDASDSLESDTLLGLNGRWSFRPDLALIAGYEYGKITTVNVGMRYSF